MWEIESTSVNMSVNRFGSPEFVISANFPGRRVSRAFAAISSFSLTYRKGDRHVSGLGVSIIDVAWEGPTVRVRGQAMINDQGGHDDPYDARITMLIFADVA